MRVHPHVRVCVRACVRASVFLLKTSVNRDSLVRVQAQLIAATLYVN